MRFTHGTAELKRLATPTLAALLAAFPLLLPLALIPPATFPLLDTDYSVELLGSLGRDYFAGYNGGRSITCIISGVSGQRGEYDKGEG